MHYKFWVFQKLYMSNILALVLLVQQLTSIKLTTLYVQFNELKMKRALGALVFISIVPILTSKYIEYDKKQMELVVISFAIFFHVQEIYSLYATSVFSRKASELRRAQFGPNTYNILFLLDCIFLFERIIETFSILLFDARIFDYTLFFECPVRFLCYFRHFPILAKLKQSESGKQYIDQHNKAFNISLIGWTIAGIFVLKCLEASVSKNMSMIYKTLIGLHIRTSTRSIINFRFDIFDPNRNEISNLFKVDKVT